MLVLQFDEAADDLFTLVFRHEVVEGGLPLCSHLVPAAEQLVLSQLPDRRSFVFGVYYVIRRDGLFGDLSGESGATELNGI